MRLCVEQSLSFRAGPGPVWSSMHRPDSPLGTVSSALDPTLLPRRSLLKGWSFIKPFLGEKDKRIMMVVLPLQVLPPHPWGPPSVSIH